MAIAVSLWFDLELETRMRRLWSDLGAAGINSSLFDGRYRPHITLGVWDIRTEADLERALISWLADKRKFSVDFRSIGIFPDGNGVVFLQPLVSSALLGFQREAYALGSRFGVPASTHCDPDRWVPHCTMAWQVTREEVLRAVDLLRLALPVEGTVAAVGMIDTPAEVELKRIELCS